MEKKDYQPTPIDTTKVFLPQDVLVIGEVLAKNGEH